MNQERNQEKIDNEKMEVDSIIKSISIIRSLIKDKLIPESKDLENVIWAANTYLYMISESVKKEVVLKSTDELLNIQRQFEKEIPTQINDSIVVVRDQILPLAPNPVAFRILNKIALKYLDLLKK